MEFVLYVIAQLLGSIFGCVLLGLIRRGNLIYTAGGTKKTAMYYISALISEIIGTFVLIMFILASCERDNYLGPMLGLAFASVIIALSTAGGLISGCSLNPAISFGSALVQVMVKGNNDPIIF